MAVRTIFRLEAVRDGRAVLGCLLALCYGCGGPAPQQIVTGEHKDKAEGAAESKPEAPQLPMTRGHREEDVRELIAVIRRTYAYVEEKKQQCGVDLDQIEAQSLKKLDVVNTDADFHDLLKGIMASLKDGHCEIYAWPLQAFKPRVWPFRLKAVKEGIVVTGIHPSLAGGAIDRGDLIREVNGRAIGAWIDEAASRVSASTNGARRKMALQRMVATADETVEVKVEHPDATVSTITVKTVPPMREPDEPTLQDPPDAAIAVGRVLTGGVGYIRIPSFGWNVPEYLQATTDADHDAALRPTRDQIDAAFAAAADTKELILDLRGNGGGAGSLGRVCPVAPDSRRLLLLLHPDAIFAGITARNRRSRPAFRGQVGAEGYLGAPQDDIHVLQGEALSRPAGRFD